MSNATVRQTDLSAIRLNQVMIIAVAALGFVLDQALVIALLALVMAIGTAIGKPGFVPLYVVLLRPLGIVRPDLAPDDPGSHRFAQGLGGGMVAVAAVALVLGAPVLGWSLVFLVVILAALNLVSGFCVGCALYLWLARSGVRRDRAS